MKYVKVLLVAMLLLMMSAVGIAQPEDQQAVQVYERENLFSIELPTSWTKLSQEIVEKYLKAGSENVEDMEGYDEYAKQADKHAAIFAISTEEILVILDENSVAEYSAEDLESMFSEVLDQVDEMYQPDILHLGITDATPNQYCKLESVYGSGEYKIGERQYFICMNKRQIQIVYRNAADSAPSPDTEDELTAVLASLKAIDQSAE